MSDNVDLSLDEYIKKKRIPRGGRGRGGKVVAGRGRNGPAKTVRGKKAGNVMQGGIRRTKRPVSVPVGRGTFTQRRGVGRGFKRVGRIRKGFPKKKTNFAVSIINEGAVFASTSYRNKRNAFGARRQNLKTRFAGDGFRQLHRINVQRRKWRNGVPTQVVVAGRVRGAQSLARKRVQRARNILAQLGANPMRRISISRSGKGLVTTSRLNNLQLQREIMQQKINRAKMVRSNPALRSSAGALVSEFPSRFFRAQLGQPNRNGRKRQGNNRNWIPNNDPWAGPVRIVRNTNMDILPPQAPRTTANSGLNPEIQRKIKLLQQQGRRNRGEDPFESAIESDFRGPVATSCVSLSDRFRMFMN
jgi:hypothetical protein